MIVVKPKDELQKEVERVEARLAEIDAEIQKRNELLDAQYDQMPPDLRAELKAFWEWVKRNNLHFDVDLPDDYESLPAELKRQIADHYDKLLEEFRRSRKSK